MLKSKSFLLAATVIAGVAAPVAAQTVPTGTATTFPAPFTTQAYLSDAKVSNTTVSAAPLSLADNPFAIQAPGNPQSIVWSGTGAAPTASGTDGVGNPTYTPQTGLTIFDGDYSVHGLGATSIQNVLVRAMNCFGTPQPLGNGQAVAGGSGPTGGSIKTLASANYVNSASLSLYCNNGTWVTQASTATAPTGGISYGQASNDGTKTLYFVPGTQTSSAELQPQFVDYSLTTGNLAAYGFSGKYIGSGSGAGQNAWAYATDVFDDGYGYTNGIAGSKHNVPNPFVSVMGQNPWSHVQFAVSDAPLAASNITTYNAHAAAKGGNAIEMPLFVLPVAIVYNTVYAATATKTYTFNVKGAATYPAGRVAVMQLTGPIYCGIFNGMITNWNDSALTQANKNVPLYDPINDNANRWNNQGAPIRLVGRMDNSGTTDVFTRHLSRVCSQSQVYGSSTASGANYFTATGVTAPLLPVADKKNFVPNKYLQNGQSLPYNSGPNYTSIRSDTHLDGSAYSASNDAGSVNTISGDFYNSGTISNIGVIDTTHYPAGTPIFSSLPTKYNGSGLFIVANGGSDLAKAINLAPDYDAITGTQNNSTGTDTNLLFNGKIGYVSADVVTGLDAVGTPTTGYLRAANLATLPTSYTATGGTYSYTYFAPTVKNALAAFNNTSGTLEFLPPESDATGAYVGASTNKASASGGYVLRSNPLAWTDQFYQDTNTYTAAGLLTETYSLAQPSQGYPIVGTTQFLTYTCFTSAGNRQAIGDLVGTLISSLTVDSTNSKINKTAFSSSSASAPGIIADSSIGIVPAAWQTALASTFLSGTSDVNTSTTGGGSANTGYASAPLNFTSSVVPTKTKINGVYVYLPTTPNAACAENGNGSGSLAGL